MVSNLVQSQKFRGNDKVDTNVQQGCILSTSKLRIQPRCERRVSWERRVSLMPWQEVVDYCGI